LHETMKQCFREIAAICICAVTCITATTCKHESGQWRDDYTGLIPFCLKDRRYTVNEIFEDFRGGNDNIAP
jgi:hypothetical protein